MSTFKNIQGKNIRSYTTNAPNAKAGEMWYNRSELKLKGVVASGAWSSTSPLNTAISYAYTGGTQNAAFSAAGAPGPKVQTEEYNGSGWSIGNNVGTARYEGGSAGTLTAGLMYGGYEGPPAPSPYPKAQTEEYDGTSWSEQNDLNTSRYSQGGFGTQTAAVYTNGGNPVADTEEYNGTSWSEGNNSTTNRFDVGTAGILTAGMIFGGQQPTPAVLSATELYDGTNWTNGPSLNNQRSQLGGSGIQTSALAFGGRYYPSPPVRAFTEQFDGTSWSEVGDLATARRQLSSPRASSSNASSLAIGGSGPGNLAITEEWNFSTNTITAAAWSSGGAYPTATDDPGSAGTRTAGLVFSGQTPAPAVTQATNEYDGSTFSSGGNTVVGRGFMAGLGTQTAAVGVGGAPSFIANSESYNGTAWSEGNDINTARGNAMGAGIQTAGLIFGGYNGSSLANTENYNGTSWTNNPNGLNTARRGSGGCGTQTAALCAGGYATNFTAVVEEYNGTSWSEVNNIPLARNTFRLVGTQTAALGSGGYLPGPQGGPGNLPTNSITYDGTTWSTNPSLATGSVRGGQAGTTTASFVTAGQLGSGTTTENFDVGTETVTASTLTTS